MTRRNGFVTLVTCLAAMGLSMGCGSSKKETTSAENVQEESDAPSALELYNHYMAQAGIALSEDRHEDALDLYLDAANALDESGQITVKRADAHYQAAEMAYQRYKKELAIEEYQKAVDIYLRFQGNSKVKAAVALTNMGVIWKEKNDKARARTCWQQALKIYKDAPQTGQNTVHMRKVQQNIQDLDEGF